MSAGEAAISAACQRWRDRRASYRALRGEAFDRRIFAVDVIDEARAKAFTIAHHYSRSYPAAVARIGLFGPRAQLVGVAVFSVPMNQRVVPRYCGLVPEAGVELGRFVILDTPECSANCETFFLGRAMSVLREEKPRLRAVVSYADPVARRDEDGRVLMPGHVGTIYQAFNSRYLGRGAARTLHLAPDGRVVSPRMLSKIRLDERGAAAAYRALLAIGAPARCLGESGQAYVERVLASGLLRALRHPGNHVYAWALGDRRGRRAAEAGFSQAHAYPKRRAV